MSPGNTRTGGVLEDMVLPALRHGGWEYKVQERIGKRLGLGAHMVDVVAAKDGRTVLVSMKWQQGVWISLGEFAQAHRATSLR